MIRVQAGSPVSGENFIGRDGEISKIIQLLELGQSVVIIAPRRFGKTSMVLEILRRMKTKDQFTSYVDVFSSPTIELLSAQIIEAVLKNHRLDRIFTKSRHSALAMMRNLKLKAVVEDFDFMLGFSEKQKNEWSLLQESISFIDSFAKRHKKKMICAFDEFGDVSKLDGDKIVKLFRSGIQNHKNTSCIFSGSYESVMNAMFIEKNAPFFRFARIFHINYIDRVEFGRYYDKTLSGFQFSANSAYTEAVLDFTEGHPYYSQLALQEMLIEHLLNGALPDIKDLQSQMLNIEKDYLEKSWEDISSSKERVRILLAVVKSGSGVYSSLSGEGINIYRGLRDLIHQGVIFKDSNKKFSLSDPLLKFWIKRNILRDQN